ncbi:MAG: dipeptide ABC transporter ATP-binding protein [Deltaproteobacteria bacterium]|nr:dipeptide ABC transporter ATP-binding protein [Deltaproteobacteria bacterium]
MAEPRLAYNQESKEPVAKARPKPLLRVYALQKHFPITKGLIRARETGVVRAVDGVDFDMFPGETLAVVGESGCGKSTLGRLVLRLLRPTNGEIIYNHERISNLSAGQMRRLRGELQIIFQDPFASLNPRLTVSRLIREPLDVHLPDSPDKKGRVAELLRTVGLAAYQANRYPHEFSGGQRQRIGVARALAANPHLVVCDEPVSALDVSIQAQVLNLIRDLQRRFNLSYLFISHDLAVVKHISDRVAVMYLGKFVELTTKEELYSRPLHPYSQALLAAVPIPDPHARGSKVIIKGDVPSPINPPSGCRFHTRCPKVQDICKQEEPMLIEKYPGHKVACHFAEVEPSITQQGRPANQRFEKLVQAFYA